ncbi:MAG: patatin-like phospholipase family protein, partial [Burkholderiales bacterium]|nr:patatin-like phospholipase family protein [Burkholderiales bacterium]
MPSARKSPAPCPVDLALQGGGSHGAFTWGVLDRLLEDEAIAIDGISGTSAGALNAGVLASGYARGGRAGARAALEAFWRDVAGAGGCFGAARAAPTAAGLAGFNLDANPFYQWFSHLSQAFSPYQLNPLDINPLRDLTRRHVDEAALRSGPLTVFVTATAVRTGQPRVFQGTDLSVDALLASCCLPQVFQAVEIDGEAYWDGGYSGNPAIWPLIYNTPALDVVLVQINPLVRPKLPQSADEIADRVNEITFNAGLVAEMRAIAFVQRLVGQGRLDAGEYKSLRLHMIADQKGLAPLDQSSKLNTAWPFLQDLHRMGRA